MHFSIVNRLYSLFPGIRFSIVNRLYTARAERRSFRARADGTSQINCGCPNGGVYDGGWCPVVEWTGTTGGRTTRGTAAGNTHTGLGRMKLMSRFASGDNIVSYFWQKIRYVLKLDTFGRRRPSRRRFLIPIAPVWWITYIFDWSHTRGVNF